MNDCKETITIPDGCYATIEGNKVVFRKWAYPIPRALEVAALHWREVNLDFEQELYKAFGQVKDFTLGMRIAKHFYELGIKTKKGE